MHGSGGFGNCRSACVHSLTLLFPISLTLGKVYFMVLSLGFSIFKMEDDHSTRPTDLLEGFRAKQCMKSPWHDTRGVLGTNYAGYDFHIFIR